MKIDYPDRQAVLNQLIRPLPVVDWWSDRVANLPGPARLTGSGSLTAAFGLGQYAGDVGAAFFAGYQVALQVLQAKASLEGQSAAVCVTEAKGNRPRQIETRLVAGPSNRSDNQWVLEGTKSFVTGADKVDQWLVLACTGFAEDGLKRFKLVVIDVHEALGRVQCTELPPLSVVPTVPHGKVVFEGYPIAAEQLLPGCGYVDYIKRFRWLEDIHVMASVLGAVHSLGRVWQMPALEVLGLSLFCTLSNLGVAPQAGEEADVVVFDWLSGTLKSQLPELLQQRPDRYAAQAEAFHRDLKIFDIARGVREQRVARYWAAHGDAAGQGSQERV